MEEVGSPGSLLGVSYLGLHLTRCVAWGKLLHLSEPSFFTDSLSAKEGQQYLPGTIQGMSWILPDLWSALHKDSNWGRGGGPLQLHDIPPFWNIFASPLPVEVPSNAIRRPF